jgi:hypothetical protein
MLKIGIEQEFVFADSAGSYLDADNTGYPVFSAIVDEFPAFEGDDAWLDCKSLETFPKRCYVEGFEHHDAQGKRIETLPKGLEIRTLPHDSVEGVVTEFRNTFSAVMGLAARTGLVPLLISRHPFKTSIGLRALSGEVERRVRTEQELALAMRAMLSHGMHVNVSLQDASAGKMQDLVEKVNYYLPALIPWSFSSPFYQGKVFEGLCSRNYLRADSRRMADMQDRRGACVLEFRGFDACGDANLLAAVLTLYCGFLLDESLAGRSRQQDPELLRHSSLVGFGDPILSDLGMQILRASQAAIANNSGGFKLLEAMLRNNDSYAKRMKQKYAETGDIVESMHGWYDF